MASVRTRTTKSGDTTHAVLFRHNDPTGGSEAMSEQHEFPPTTNPGIYWCRHCGLVTSRRPPDPCPARRSSADGVS